MTTTCPEAEAMARLAEGAADGAERESIVEHAADCAACRRHLAIVSLPPLPEPAAPARRRSIFGVVWSVAAAGLAAAALVYALTMLHPAAPAPPVVDRPAPPALEGE